MDSNVFLDTIESTQADSKLAVELDEMLGGETTDDLQWGMSDPSITDDSHDAGLFDTSIFIAEEAGRKIDRTHVSRGPV